MFFTTFLELLLGEGNGTTLRYSCLENPMGSGGWWAAVHGVAKSRTRLSGFTFSFHSHALEKAMATHSSVLAWRIPGRGSLAGCRLWGRTGRTRLSDSAAAGAHTVLRWLPCLLLFVLSFSLDMGASSGSSCHGAIYGFPFYLENIPFYIM